MRRFIWLLLPMVLLGLSACHQEQKTTTQKEQPPVIKINQAAKIREQKQPGEFTTIQKPKRAPIELTLYSKAVSQEPSIDGAGNDSVWQQAKPIKTLDYSSMREITIRSVHTKNKIFFLAEYPDAAPSMTQKSLGWDYEEGIYKQLNDREDCFIFKWLMTGTSLRFKDRKPHTADIWYWKAARTNPLGYADDKYQDVSFEDHGLSSLLEKAGQKPLYVTRHGDLGEPVYHESPAFDYSGDVVSKYRLLAPTGSRADVKATGVWKNGKWTIEFSRQLDTQHPDDIQFKIGRRYTFGVGLYELVGMDKITPEYAQPLWYTGDVFDTLYLVVER